MIDAISGQYFAIVDYGVGNIFSVKNACDVVGIPCVITSDKKEIFNASGLFLPGVGAFNDAMMALESKDLVETLNQCVKQNKLVIGICLGMQLLMSESYEFGHHKGLGFIEGSVLPLEAIGYDQNCLKIPHVGWNRIFRNNDGLHQFHRENCDGKDLWESTPLEDISDGEYMYFVHSYYIKPKDKNLIIATSRYGKNEFCSVIRKGNIFGMQFHPEKSGHFGLKIYKNISNLVRKKNW